MIPLRYLAMPTDIARALQAGGPDAHGNTPERHISDGQGVPCRHCLQPVAEGDPYLILAYSPFAARQPYAETGPVFLHVGHCSRHDAEAGPPVLFLERESWLMRGYGYDDRIVYGTGGPVAGRDTPARAADLLGRADIAYVHLRSAEYNCFHGRIERG